MANLLQDVRFAFRLLLRNPGVALVAIVSLALGVGANTTVFTLVNAILLHPLPIRDIDRVVMVSTKEVRNGTPAENTGTSRLNFEDLRSQANVFSDASIMAFTPMAMAGGGEPEQVFGQLVSGSFFDLLGAPLAAGRGFGAEDDRDLGARPVTVLSYGLWQRRFGGRPDVVGQGITLNGHPFTVIGVTGEGFRGTFPVGGPDLWVPMAMYREVLTGLGLEGYSSRRSLMYQGVARLKDGVTLEQARANADAIGKALERDFPTDNRGRTFGLLPVAASAFPPQFRQQLTLSGSVGMTVVALVLLIACGNVANLLLARAHARRQEIAVRLSIGASRGRLVRQLLTESVLLALLGGLGGLVVAYWARALLWAYRPPFIQPNSMDLGFDARILSFAALVSLATGILFGLAPAIQASRPDMVTELKERTTLPGGTRWYNVRHLLVAGQVALSLVALVSAGLFLRSLSNAQRIDLGFQSDGLVILGMNAGTQGFDEARGRDLYRRALERLAGVPGVEVGNAFERRSAVPVRVHAHDVSRRSGHHGSEERPADAGERGGRPLLRNARHPHRPRPGVHAGGPDWLGAGHHHQRDDGEAVLPQRGGARPPNPHHQSASGPRDRRHREDDQVQLRRRGGHRLHVPAAGAELHVAGRWCRCAPRVIPTPCSARCGASCRRWSRRCRC